MPTAMKRGGSAGRSFVFLEISRIHIGMGKIENHMMRRSTARAHGSMGMICGRHTEGAITKGDSVLALDEATGDSAAVARNRCQAHQSWADPCGVNRRALGQMAHQQLCDRRVP